jgi:hypothetical protein
MAIPRHPLYAMIKLSRLEYLDIDLLYKRSPFIPSVQNRKKDASHAKKSLE